MKYYDNNNDIATITCLLNESSFLNLFVHFYWFRFSPKHKHTYNFNTICFFFLQMLVSSSGNAYLVDYVKMIFWQFESFLFSLFVTLALSSLWARGGTEESDAETLLWSSLWRWQGNASFHHLITHCISNRCKTMFNGFKHKRYMHLIFNVCGGWMTCASLCQLYVLNKKGTCHCDRLGLHFWPDSWLQGHIQEPVLRAVLWSSCPASACGAAVSESWRETGFLYQHLQRPRHPWEPSSGLSQKHMAKVSGKRIVFLSTVQSGNV